MACDITDCSAIARVLFVRNRLHPVGTAFGAQRRAYGYVDHEGVGPRAVPVPLVRGEVDDVSGLYLDDGLAFSLCPTGAGNDVEELALRVGVPVRARTRLEEHAEETRTRRGNGRRLQPDIPGEPLLWPAPGLHVPRRNYLHDDLPSVGSKHQVSGYRFQGFPHA